jgi:hypothetical protein
MPWACLVVKRQFLELHNNAFGTNFIAGNNLERKFIFFINPFNLKAIANAFKHVDIDRFWFKGCIRFNRFRIDEEPILKDVGTFGDFEIHRIAERFKMFLLRLRCFIAGCVSFNEKNFACSWVRAKE